MERIPGCWIEQKEWNLTERPWMVIQCSSSKFHIWSMLLAPNTSSWDCVTGSMMGIYDDKVEQIDLKGQLKPFNINQLNRVMHILGQRRLGFDTSSIPTDDIPEESQMGPVIK